MGDRKKERRYRKIDFPVKGQSVFLLYCPIAVTQQEFNLKIFSLSKATHELTLL